MPIIKRKNKWAILRLEWHIDQIGFCLSIILNQGTTALPEKGEMPVTEDHVVDRDNMLTLFCREMSAGRAK